MSFGVHIAEKFLGLTMELIEVGTDGQAAIGHTSRWTQSCPRTGGALSYKSNPREPGASLSSDRRTMTPMVTVTPAASIGCASPRMTGNDGAGADARR